VGVLSYGLRRSLSGSFVRHSDDVRILLSSVFLSTQTPRERKKKKKREKGEEKRKRRETYQTRVPRKAKVVVRFVSFATLLLFVRTTESMVFSKTY
jgi:hypothetical protein